MLCVSERSVGLRKVAIDLPREDLTKRLNDVYAKLSSKLDPAWEAASLEVLRWEKW